MRRKVWHFFSAREKTRCETTMPRSLAGKAKRRRQTRDDRNEDFEESEEKEKEDFEEKSLNIEDIVRTEFQGDAHRALFAMIELGKKRNNECHDDDGESEEESDEEEEDDDENSSEYSSDDKSEDEEDEDDSDDEESESEESDEARRGELVSDPEDGEEDIEDDVNKVLEWEPIPDEAQKRFDRMGPQDDLSDSLSSSDAEFDEEEGKEEEATTSDAGKMMETKKTRSVRANEDGENEDRERNALTLHLKKCQNEDEETLQERREKRVTFTSMFNNKDNCGGDEKNDESNNSNARWEMSENATTLPTAFKDEAYFAPKKKKKKKKTMKKAKKKNEKNKNNDDDDEEEEDKEEEEDPLALPGDIPLKIREHWKIVRANEIRDEEEKQEEDDDDDDDDENKNPSCFKNRAQAELYHLMSTYADISHTRRIPDVSHLSQKKNKEDSTLRWRNQKDDELDAILIHAMTHIHRTRNRVSKNNEKLAKKVKAGQEISIDDTPRDQGFARPTVLFLSPMRNVCGRAIMRFLKLCPNAHGRADAVNKLERLENDFLAGYSSDETSSDEDASDEEDDEELKRRKKKMQKKINKVTKKKKKYKTHVPLEYKELFRGNQDDHFRLGVKITKAAVRPFVDFFGADIVFASPLGIVTAMNDDISAADFLSAIELVIVDRCDVVAMQNWEHLETVLEKCNQLPKDAKDVDVNRCHEFHLNGAAASARQTIFLSQFETAEINATFNGALCANVEGKFRLRATKEKGVLGLVASPDDPRNLRKNESATLPNLISRQEFELVRVSKKNIQDADDIRFRHFAKVVLPRIRENPDQGQLIFCATYFEFVRVRNLLVDREVSFAINSEYTDIAEAARARTLFADGRKRCLLLSERAYFYQRRNIRGVNSVFFYSLPENPQFYAEVCSFMKNPSPTRNHQSNTKNQFRGGGRGAGVSGNKTAHALFTRLDALKIERVCGTKRGKKMIQETKEVDKKDNDMFVFC